MHLDCLNVNLDYQTEGIKSCFPCLSLTYFVLRLTFWQDEDMTERWFSADFGSEYKDDIFWQCDHFGNGGGGNETRLMRKRTIGALAEESRRALFAAELVVCHELSLHALLLAASSSVKYVRPVNWVSGEIIRVVFVERLRRVSPNSPCTNLASSLAHLYMPKHNLVSGVCQCVRARWLLVTWCKITLGQRKRPKTGSK